MAIAHEHGREFLRAGEQAFPRALHINPVAHFQAHGFRGEGQNAPVDQVCAVATRGVFFGDVRDAAQHALARGRLFAGGAIARAIRPDAGTDGRLLRLRAHQRENGLRVRLAIADGLRAAHIAGIAPRKREFRKPHGVGTIARRFAGRDQFVRGGDCVVERAGDADEHILLKGGKGRPIGDVGAEAQRRVLLRMAKAIVHVLLIDLPIERALVRPVARVVDRAGRREHAAVERRGGDGARVHQRDSRGLPLSGLRAFAVGEVARGMPRGKALVARHVARAEAGPAEAGLDRCARAHQGGQVPAFGQRQIHRQARGIHREREAAHAPAAQDGGRLGHVLVQAARAARDHALIHLEAAVVPLFPQPRRIFEDVRRVLQEFLDGIGVRRMIGQGDHGLEPGKVQPHKPVVIRALLWRQRAEIPFPAMPRVKCPRDLVRRPNGRKAGGLRRHHVQRQAEIHGQGANARAHEFQNLIFHKSVLIYRAAQGQSRVVRAHAMGYFAFHIDQNHLRLAQIVGLPQ